MIIALIVVGVILVNVILAYVPIILVIGYTLRPKPPKDDLLDRYVRDEISTEEYVIETEWRWKNTKHAPLTPGE